MLLCSNHQIVQPHNFTLRRQKCQGMCSLTRGSHQTKLVLKTSVSQLGSREGRDLPEHRRRRQGAWLRAWSHFQRQYRPCCNPDEKNCMASINIRASTHVYSKESRDRTMSVSVVRDRLRPLVREPTIQPSTQLYPIR